MCPRRNQPCLTPCARRGLTLVELMLALTVMTFIMGALAVLAHGVQIAANYSDSHGTAVQHGRVVLERIGRKLREAYAIDTLPGAIVVDTQLGTFDYPSTLVIWHPAGAPGNTTGTPVNAAGPPLISELTIYAPNPSSPNELWEVTDASNTAQFDISSATATQTAVNAILKNNTAKKTVLTNLVRAALTSSSTATTQQACVRFALSTSPSATDWMNYKSGVTAWSDLPWPQYLYGATEGMRQVWLRTELQLNAGPIGGIVGNDEDVLPFIGSAALNYELHQ